MNGGSFPSVLAKDVCIIDASGVALLSSNLSWGEGVDGVSISATHDASICYPIIDCAMDALHATRFSLSPIDTVESLLMLISCDIPSPTSSYFPVSLESFQGHLAVSVRVSAALIVHEVGTLHTIRGQGQRW